MVALKVARSVSLWAEKRAAQRAVNWVGTKAAPWAELTVGLLSDHSAARRALSRAAWWVERMVSLRAVHWAACLADYLGVHSVAPKVARKAYVTAVMSAERSAVMRAEY